MDINKCGNPLEAGKPVYVSDYKQLANWLNRLATAIGVRKSPTYTNGYEATEQPWYLEAKAKDVQE